MDPNGNWSSQDFHTNLMTPGDYNLDGQFMDTLPFELDGTTPPGIDHNVPINARRVQGQTLGYDIASTSSRYHTTPDSSQVPEYYTAPTVYTSYTSSSVSESSRQYQQNPHQDKPPADPSLSRTNEYAGIGSGFPNPPCPPDLNIPTRNDANTVEPTISGLNADETFAPALASVRPGPDSWRTPTSHDLGVASQGAQSTANDDPLGDAAMQRPGPYPIRQRVFSARQGLDALFPPPTRSECMQILPPPPLPSVSQPIRKQRRKPRVAYRCRDRVCDRDEECGVTAVGKQSFRRHVETQHYPQYDYHCDVQNCSAFWERRLHRPDKLLDHYPRAHGLDPPSQSVIEAYRLENLCPPFCALCRRTVTDWEDFYGCFLDHCKEAPKASASRDSHRRGKRRRDRDNSDKGNFNGGTSNGGFVSQQGYGHFGNAGEASNPWPSGSDGYQQGRSHQQGGCNQHSSRPQLDPSNLQGQPTSQGSRSHCKSCQHPFKTCSSCCKSPPSTPLCHACPAAQRALTMQAGVFDTSPSRKLLPHTGQTMRVADHAGTNLQAFYNGNLSIPTMTAANHSLYGALPQGPQQLNMRRQQQAQAHDLRSGIDTQQSPVSIEQSLTVDAARDEAAGISELKIEPFISDSKSKKGQTSDDWSCVLTLGDSSLPARKPDTSVNVITPHLIGPLFSNKLNPSSMCQCPCRTSPQGTYFARSRMDIAPGRRIEMDFKITPEARPGFGHPLRTRIHVVIKILRLRSSVAKSANGKNKPEAHAVLKKTREVPQELVKAVEPFEEEEKKIELMFDLDLQSSLKKLSPWTRSPTGNPFSDLSVQDQYRIFDYFARCMRFVLFVIVSLARAQDYDYNSYPCSAKKWPGEPQDYVSYAGYDYDTQNSHMIC